MSSISSRVSQLSQDGRSSSQEGLLRDPALFPSETTRIQNILKQNGHNLLFRANSVDGSTEGEDCTREDSVHSIVGGSRQTSTTVSIKGYDIGDEIPSSSPEVSVDNNFVFDASEKLRNVAGVSEEDYTKKDSVHSIVEGSRQTSTTVSIKDDDIDDEILSSYSEVSADNEFVFDALEKLRNMAEVSEEDVIEGSVYSPVDFDKGQSTIDRSLAKKLRSRLIFDCSDSLVTAAVVVGVVALVIFFASPPGWIAFGSIAATLVIVGVATFLAKMLKLYAGNKVVKVYLKHMRDNRIQLYPEMQILQMVQSSPAVANSRSFRRYVIPGPVVLDLVGIWRVFCVVIGCGTVFVYNQMRKDKKQCSFIINLARVVSDNRLVQSPAYRDKRVSLGYCFKFLFPFLDIISYKVPNSPVDPRPYPGYSATFRSY